MEYQYPIDIDWKTEEIMDVIAFFQAVEKVHEKGMDRQEFMSAYRNFKEIVPSIAEEKRLGKEFEEVSGYSLYRAVKAAKTADQDILKL